MTGCQAASPLYIDCGRAPRSWFAGLFIVLGPSVKFAGVRTVTAVNSRASNWRITTRTSRWLRHDRRTQTVPVAGGEPAEADLVAGWWEYCRLAVGSRADRLRLEAGEPASAVAAWEAVGERIDRGGGAALDLVAALLDAARDDEEVGEVGAGPLEDLLAQHGSALAEEVERLAGREPRFRAALRAVWLSPGELGSAAERRLARWLPMPWLEERSAGRDESETTAARRKRGRRRG